MRDKEIEIFVEVCRKDAILPAYARPGDAGMDIFAAEEVLIGPGETVIIPTGLKMAIPEGYELQVRPRSGISYKTPLRLSNSPGTVDSGYRDEIGVIMTNTSPERNSGDGETNLEKGCDDGDISSEKGSENSSISPGGSSNDCGIYSVDNKGNKKGTYKIKKGDRIAQIVLQRVPRMIMKPVASVEDIGTNRGGGFGSTGIR